MPLSFSTEDTIVAIATPLGRAALGIVRLSGADAPQIAGTLLDRDRPLVARRATLARLKIALSNASAAGDRRAPVVGDHVVATFFPAPHSYTGEHVIELSAHGSPVVLEAILRAVVSAGARLAEPGEFSLRAFLHGKLDLVQAEAVADLIDAVTPLQARTAFDQLEGTLTRRIGEIEQLLFDLRARLEASLDFPEEGYHFIGADTVGAEIAAIRTRITTLLGDARRGRLVRDGAQVVIVGSPNVGKSSLFNALLNTNRAIVSPTPGTTRDLVSERVDLEGLSLTLIDTAGVHQTTDAIEHEGIARTRGAARVAELLLVVLDRSRPRTVSDSELITATTGRPRVIIVNKIDAPAVWTADELGVSTDPVVETSVHNRTGLDMAARAIAQALGGEAPLRDAPAISNLRQIDLLERVALALARAENTLAASNQTISEEFLLSDLQDASSMLEEITGRRAPDDLLRRIFERFCVGK
jgi:tRNA modification GTPase